jgi:hypothetical protein
MWHANLWLLRKQIIGGIRIRGKCTIFISVRKISDRLKLFKCFVTRTAIVDGPAQGGAEGVA